MRKSMVLTVVVGLLLAGYGMWSGGVWAADDAAKPTGKVLRHVVLFKFKDRATPEDIKKIEEAFCALPGKIPVIHGFEWGTDVSTENLAQGITHCFILTFRTEADRAVYLPHPEHKAFGAMLGPHLDKVIVVDYWTKP